MAAQPTPTGPRTYVAPDGSGTATGSSGADDIYATADGQTLIGNGGNDIFHIGTHTGLTIQETDPGISTVATYLTRYTLADGIDNLTADGTYAHQFTGNALDNVITGNAGDDTIDGGAGADILIGGGGHDTFVVRAGGGSDRIDDFTSGAGGDVVNLVGYGVDFAYVQANLHNIAHDSGSELLLPNGERLTFLGANGAASAGSFTAANFLFDGAASSSAGGQQITGTAGDDRLAGGAGNDTIDAAAGNDHLDGGAGNDALRGGDGLDVLTGGAGADFLDGGADNDTAAYDTSPTGVSVDLAAGTGSAGDAAGDRLISIESVIGSNFNDFLAGTDARDVLLGGTGDDIIEGRGGNDFLEGGGGNDSIDGGAGDDVLQAGTTAHSPTPTDNGGFVTLDGGAGNDTLFGGAHTTHLIQHGEGSDTIVNYVAGGTVVIDGYAAGDRAALLSHVTFSGNAAVIDLGGGETLTFAVDARLGTLPSNYFDNVTFEFRNVAPDSSPDGDGPTPTPAEQRGYVAADGTGTAHGTAAAEDIFATGDNQTLIGGGGNDVFHVGTYSGLTIDASGPGITTVSTWGNFTLGDNVDNLTANGAYAHSLTGNALDNVITGNAGNDTIYGAGGDDLLVGRGGNDVFRFTGFSDSHIADWSEGDRIDLRGLVSGDDQARFRVVDDGHGNASVEFSTAAPFEAPNYQHIVTLDHVAASSIDFHSAFILG